MKNLFILFSLLLSLSAWTKSDFLQDHRKYLSQWHRSLDGNKEGNELATFSRLISVKKKTFSIAEVTVMKVRYQGEKDVSSVRTFLGKEFKLRGLQERKLGAAYRFEGYHEGIRRQVVIFVSFEGNFIKTATAQYRPFYGRKLALETELLLRLYHRDAFSKKVVKSFEHILRLLDLAVPSAHAQISCDSCSGNPYCQWLCGMASGEGGNPPFELPDFNWLPGAIDEVSGDIRNLQGSIDTSNGHWGNSNENWEETNGLIRDATDRFSQQLAGLQEMALSESQSWRAFMEQTSAQMAERADRGLAVAERMALVSERMADPNHLFKMAAFSAAGAVIGASVANLAIQGVRQAISKISDWASGRLARANDQRIYQEFAEMVQAYEKSNATALELEGRIDQVLQSIQSFDTLSRDYNIPNIYMSVRVAITQKEDQIAALTERARNGEDCSLERASATVDLEELQALLGVVQQLGYTRNTQSDPRIAACADLNRTMEELANLEYDLMLFRSSFLTDNNEESVVQHLSRMNDHMAEAFQQAQGGRATVRGAEAHRDAARRLILIDTEQAEVLQGRMESNCRSSIGAVVARPDRSQRRAIDQYCRGVHQARAGVLNIPGFSGGQLEQIQEGITQSVLPLQSTYQTLATRIQGHRDYISTQSERAEAAPGSDGDIMFNSEVARSKLAAISGYFDRLRSAQTIGSQEQRRQRIDEYCAGFVRN